VAKRQLKTPNKFDSSTEARLSAVGQYEMVSDPGYCEIHFNPIPALASDLGAFGMSWFITAPERATPAPDDQLFALWERYRAAHPGLCKAYQQLLFDLFSQSDLVGYDDGQWRQLRRARPNERDLRSVVSAAGVRLEQRQHGKGEPSPVYEVRVEFVVFWNAHGVAVQLRDSDGKFEIGKWAGIGDL
jgi:hypothetical protein